MDGVISTKVGYAGGISTSPTYKNLDGHSETVQVRYDPARISYRQLLEVFWNGHNPAVGRPRQYMSIIFYHDQQQKMVAELSRQEYEKESGNQAVTEIVPFSVFYPAEDYHQKYYLSRVPDLYSSYRQIYPEMDDLLASTAVARINGYIGNYGSLELMEKELGNLGLTEAGLQRVYQFTGSGLCPA